MDAGTTATVRTDESMELGVDEQQTRAYLLVSARLVEVERSSPRKRHGSGKWLTIVCGSRQRF